MAGEPGDRGQAAPSRSRRARGDRRGDRVLGGVLHRAGQPQQLAGVCRRAPATTSTRLIRPVVTVPVLSSTTVSIGAGGLQHLRALDQDAELGAPAGADQQRGRRGQAQRARAGDDQHRHRGGERRHRRPAPAASQPISVTTAMPMTTGTNTAETRSASRCTGALPVLRLLDQPGHLGQLSVRAHPGRPDHQPAAGVHASAGHRVARPDLDRDRLAGEHRGIDCRAAAPRRPRRWRSSRRAGPRTGHRRPAALAGTRTSAPSRSTATSLAPIDSSARSAAPERRLARASR